MQKWWSGSWRLSKGRQRRKNHLPRAYSRLKSRRLRHINLGLAMVLSLVGAVALAVFAGWVLAHQLNVGTDPTPPADLTRLALTIAAGVGGVVALVVAYRRQRDLEQGRFVEAFGAAAKQLGDADVAVRLAGVYAMAGVADQVFELERQQCIDVLCGYLRLPYSPELGNNHQVSLSVRSPVLKEGGAEQESQFQYRQNDKVVRQTIVRVIAAHLRRGAPHSWTSNDFDFTSSHFEETNFTGAIFSGRRTSFDGATFSGGHTWFEGAAFSGENTSFQGATFSGGHTWFEGAAFSGENTSFQGATFSGGHTWFEGVTFSCGNTRFDGVTFNGGRTSFDDARFSGLRTWFDGATFSGRITSFDGVTFSGEITSFDGATFSGGITSFGGVNFGVGKVTFEAPKAWDPAPVFDWDEEKDPVNLKPANVEPENWPPPVARENL